MNVDFPVGENFLLKKQLRAGFKGERQGRLPWGLHKIEIEPTDFILTLLF
jgi:hypothetical protein